MGGACREFFRCARGNQKNNNSWTHFDLWASTAVDFLRSSLRPAPHHQWRIMRRSRKRSHVKLLTPCLHHAVPQEFQNGTEAFWQAMICNLAVGGESEWFHGLSRIPYSPQDKRGGTADVLGQDSASRNTRDCFRACVYSEWSRSSLYTT